MIDITISIKMPGAVVLVLRGTDWRFGFWAPRYWRWGARLEERGSKDLREISGYCPFSTFSFWLTSREYRRRSY